MNHVLYFAYGSNMNLEQMRYRCSGHHAVFLKRVRLDGWRFCYRGYSRGWGGGVATIVPEPDGHVWGALWEIDRGSLAVLDRYEGYPSFYDRFLVTVRDDGGTEYEALVYEMQGNTAECLPSDGYREAVFRGAMACGLPEDYIRRFIL